MARKLKEVKTSERLNKLRKESENLSGFDKALLDSLLIEYDALAEMAEDLRFMVQEEGVMIEKEVGTANNRHLDTVPHPGLQPYERTIGRMGDVAKKISDFAKRSDVDSSDDDEFDNF